MPLSSTTSKIGLEHGVDGEVVAVGSHHVHPAQVLLGAGLVAGHAEHVDEELGSQVHQELLVQVDCQNGGAGTVGAHGQQLIKAAVAVHQVATEEDDDTLDTVSLAQKLGLLCQQLQALSCYLEVEPIGWQVDQFVEVVVRQMDNKSSCRGSRGPLRRGQSARAAPCCSSSARIASL